LSRIERLALAIFLIGHVCFFAWIAVLTLRK
jgi:hypothetical protein